MYCVCKAIKSQKNNVLSATYGSGALKFPLLYSKVVSLVRILKKLQF